MHCTKCGTQVAQGTMFCTGCGAIVDVRVESSQQPQAPQQPQQQYQTQQPQAQYQQPQTQYQQPQAPYQQNQALYQQNQPPQQNAYQQQAYTQPQRVAVAHYAPGSFIERLHQVGGSVLFMVGIILFTAGSLFSVFATFTPMSIFDILILALPITGFWLIFVSSKSPKLPEKVMPSLTLFKVSIIIELVLISLSALILLIASIALFALLPMFGFVILLIAGGLVTYIILYFQAVLGMIGGIRANIISNTFHPLAGIKRFTILTYIGVGFSVLTTLFSLLASAILTGLINQLLWNMPAFIAEIANDFIRGIFSPNPINALMSLALNGGIVVCIVAVNAFNATLLRGANPRLQ